MRVSHYTLDRFDHAGLSLGIRRYGNEQGRRAAGPDTPAQSPTFVLVHGIGVSPRYYDRLARHLTPHGLVYSVELPGFGNTPRPGRAVSVEEFASLLSAFSEAYDLHNPVLVGHSMGTQIVTETAIQNPTLTDRVVLLGAVVDPQAPTPFAQGFRLLRDMLVEPPSSNWIVATDYLRCGPRWYFTELPVMLEYRLEERLPLLEASALIVRGARDPVAPAEWNQRITELVPRATRIDIPKSAHVVQHRGARVLADAIAEHAISTTGDRDLQMRGESGR
jgi:pimeloyl-ACP methyl ester carboxylesterase